MASPVPLDLFSLFHAIGNTPAVCLTQDIPGDEPASLLLLGCGDARNILFTSYMNSSPARNVLLYTLILDDEGADAAALWNIYYHLFIDDNSLSILESQIKKLCRFSCSLRHWHKSRYGHFLRFCDSKTLSLVRDVWYSYIHISDKVTYTASFRSAIQACVDVKAAAAAIGVSLNGARSAAPNAVQALKDLPGLHSRYWKNGSTSNDAKAPNACPNPTLAPLENDTAMLHFATNPLLGFHLITAYTLLDPESPFYRKEPANTHTQSAVEAARLQFNTWCQYLRDDHESVTIRFFTGDALAFCHTLQHLKTTKEISANWFRTFYHFDTFSLDGEDYAPHGAAPLAFDVIDTSNLIDFLGGINLFIAAGPLLRKKISSTLYAESLTKCVPDVDMLLDALFTGHFPTVSILLGVFPVQYWTNSSAVANAEEQLMQDIHKRPTGHGVNTQSMYNRTLWKYQAPIWTDSPGSSSCPLIKFDSENLASVLFGIYLKMFMNEVKENTKLTLANPKREMVLKDCCIRCHRGSFVRFLLFVKGRVNVNWDKTMSVLVTFIEKDKILAFGPNFLHEFHTQLHIHGVYSSRPFIKELIYDRASHGFRAWKKLPELVSITVEVPRAKLSVFTKMPRVKLGTPFINGFVQLKHIGLQSLFAAVQLGFGQVVGSGAPNNDNFAVTVVEDHSGWKGKSPLIISFVVPSTILLVEPESTTVGVSLYHTPAASLAFGKTLGSKLVVFSSDLRNESSVYVSKQRPNNAGMPRVSERSGNEEGPEKIPECSYHTTLTADTNREKGIIIGFTARIDFLSEEAKTSLKLQKTVELSQPSPCALCVTVERNSLEIMIHFPTPVLKAKSKIRVARTSSYVEIVACRARKPDRQGHPDYIFPMLLDKNGQPVVWNIPYLNPNRLPMLDIDRMKDFGWLVTHASTMFTGKECRLRTDIDVNRPKHIQDSRLWFKDTLFSLHMSFAKVHGSNCKVFGLSCGEVGLQLLFFRSSVRLDMSNHTLALEVAIIPLPLDMDMEMSMGSFITRLVMDGSAVMVINEEELKLWKRLLPTFVERCREWKHKPTCEYKTESRIPRSVEFHSALCSCGNGIFPPNFISAFPEWEMVSKYAVRGLIPLLFTLPYLDPKDNLDEGEKAKQNRCEACGAEKSVHGRALLSCSQCNLVRYCSSKCQRTHWKVHRKTCLGKTVGDSVGK
ncbi:hypothetical protein AJ78_08148 [Emergomyces pasteurianus Ep9510]|uniref:MYND-type domain-containing protein n=1 Tax=Emergomyces pasteurianus Ep9510 TaxID=1447872 RepID=A0A1J9PT00_9EURO|nr:hypothetical protein AJ78_08148 [Emergomyces pasteurianus Ep9510]